MAQKKATIFSLVDRAFLLSDFRFHTQNLMFIINILLDNDYSLTFIFDTVNQRIKNLIKNRYITHKVRADNVYINESVSWFTVPFIPFQSEKFKRFNKNDIRVAFHSPNKLGKYDTLKYRRIFVHIHRRAMWSTRFRVIITMRHTLDRRADN